MEEVAINRLADAETRLLSSDGTQLAGSEPLSLPLAPGTSEGCCDSGGRSQEGEPMTRKSEEELERLKAELLEVKEQW